MVPSRNESTTRRTLLAVVAGATTGLAGCRSGKSGATPSESETAVDATPSESEPNPDDTPTESEPRSGATPSESESSSGTPDETEQRCVAGEREVGSAPGSVDGAWSQFQAGPANTGYSVDATGPTDPSLAWRYATCATLADSPPVVAGGSVYVGGDSLRAFDAATGESEWRVEGITSPTAPVVTGDTVYFAGRDLVAVDRADGTVVWRDGRESDILAFNSPTLADGTLYVPGAVDDPTVRAFDAATGEQRWELALDGEHGPRPPAVAGDRVYVTDWGDRLVSVGTDGGDTQVLAGGPDDPGVFSAPAVADGTVYVGGLEGQVRAFDAATGEQRWARRLSESGIPGPPVVGDGHLYVVEDGAVHALTTDGGQVWERPGEGDGLGLPVRAGDTLYVGGYTGRRADGSDPAGLLTALDVTDGSERWSLETRGYWTDDGGRRAGTTAPVAVADGVVFAATGAGDLFAFG